MPFDTHPGDDPLYMPPVGDDPEPAPDAVVTAPYFQEPWWYHWGFGHPDDWRGGFIEIGGIEFPIEYDLLPAPATDEELIEVKTNITRALTPAEQKAIDNLLTAIAKVTVVINALPDGAKIKMPDGSIIYASDFKALWAKTDFVINDVGYNQYENKSGRGEANYNFGDAQISFNIDLLEDYNKNESGVISLVFHEIGHMTFGSRYLIERLNENDVADEDALTRDEELAIERYANDIAHAFSTYVDFDVFPWGDNPASGGFSPTPPTITLSDGGQLNEPIVPQWKISSVDDSGHAYLWLM